MVRHHSCFQRTFDCSINELAPGEKPGFVVISFIAVFVDRKVPAASGPGVFQSANMSEVPKVISLQVEVFAFETRDVTRTRPAELLPVEFLDGAQSLFPHLSGNLCFIGLRLHMRVWRQNDPGSATGASRRWRSICLPI